MLGAKSADSVYAFHGVQFAAAAADRVACQAAKAVDTVQAKSADESG